MPPRKHALLSPSAAHRWIPCPGSVPLEAAYREEHGDESSPAAEQGTVAHALCEWKLRTTMANLGRPGPRPVSEWIDTEMEAYTDDYVQYVLERLSQAKAEDPAAVLLLEQRLDLTRISPDMFGTADAVIISGNRVEVIDFKYGQGVLVDARANPQLMIYGIGALDAFGPVFDLEQVELTIVQPRRGSCDTWPITTADLNQWATEVAIPAAKQALSGKGHFEAGTWCRFCRIAPTCRTRAEANLSLARLDFTPPAELSDAEIAQVLAQLPELKAWAADVEAFALAAAVNQGKTWDGFKLVEGRSIRKYSSEVDVTHALTEAGVEDIFEEKLKTITALERQLGKKRFHDLLGHLVVKPAGKPALVPESDKRPALAIASAATDFQPRNTDN